MVQVRGAQEVEAGRVVLGRGALNGVVGAVRRRTLRAAVEEVLRRRSESMRELQQVVPARLLRISYPCRHSSPTDAYPLGEQRLSQPLPADAPERPPEFREPLSNRQTHRHPDLMMNVLISRRSSAI